MARKSGKIGDIQETLKDYNIKIKDIAVNDIFIHCLSKEAAKVPDYRHPSYVKHKLQDILSICILGFLADCNEWEETADFAQQKEKWLKKYLELPNGVPSSDTIRIVGGNIDAAYSLFLESSIVYNLSNTFDINSCSIPFPLSTTSIYTLFLSCRKKTPRYFPSAP